MAITKTNFINYTRCPRFVALTELKKDKLNSDVTYDEYMLEEKEEEINEVLSQMIEIDEDGNEIDLVDVRNENLEKMMKYYKQVEIEASKVVEKILGGTTKYSLNTKEQESFDFNLNGIRYLCYLDIYNENEDGINIIECKATTSNHYVSLASGFKGEDKYSIFIKKDGIYYFKDEIGYDFSKEMPSENYYKLKEKLLNRFKDGKYIYDLAVQRYFIEGEYKETGQTKKIDNTKYYLAVLNHEYVFDGYYEAGEPVYRNINGEEVIVLFDMTNFTKEMLNMVDDDRKKLEKYILESDVKSYPLGVYCQYKQPSVCKYFKPVCGKIIPYKNSSMSYLRCLGFKDEYGVKHKPLDLINEGMINLLDVPEEWITNKNHLIQREAYSSNTPYINKEKIEAAINQLQYPIYHLDFESFPCPLPRFRGEKPYMQSVFEFSLHIEHAPGICDFDKDHYTYLNTTVQDEREELVKKLCEYIDPDKGTIFAQNVTFEKGRMKELAVIFPEYKEQLLKMVDRASDLLYIIQNNSKMFKDLGFDKADCETVNYYHPCQSGSYSIKKTLPVFTDLSYANLEVKNGTEAYLTYLSYPLYTKEQYKLKYNALITYCKQDTWAMVLILDALRKLVK